MIVFVGINKTRLYQSIKNEGLQSDCCSGVLKYGNRG